MTTGESGSGERLEELEERLHRRHKSVQLWCGKNARSDYADALVAIEELEKRKAKTDG